MPMSETGDPGEARAGALWLEGLGERQKILAKLCTLKADDAQLLDAIARMMDYYTPIEKPWCFLAIEALLPPSAFWCAFHRHWRSFERPPHGRFLWALGRRRAHWRVDYMAANDAAAFAALPETLNLYRDRDDQTRVALSWRLREGVGEARRDGGFIEAKAPKAAVAGLYVNEPAPETVLFSCRAVAPLR